MQQDIWFHKYRIIRLLGRGGTAKVYLAEHIRLNSYRAIKCISKNHPFYELQLKEAQILKNLKHSCIPTIYDIEEDEDGSYIVEQYLEGETLKNYVSARGSLHVETIFQFALQLCDLIHYLHHIERPILYLDLKPENIIVMGSTIKLVDFGSAVYRDETEDGGKGYYGTAGFAAPEMYGHLKIDERCDVYGIGMLLHYMVTGKILKENGMKADNIDLYGNCPKKLKKIMNHCLKFNPSQRYASVMQLSRQLSAGRRKLPVLCESGPSVRIAIAGAQPRIGVTHFAFRLCRFLTQNRISCIYLEHNVSGCLKSIISRYEDPILRENLLDYGGIPMKEQAREEHAREEQARKDQEGGEEITGYRIIVEDLGCLKGDNLTEFLKAEIPILVLGAKDWELECAERALELVREQKELVYLFNFLDGGQFRQAMANMDHRNCFRIPYEPNPARKTVKGAELEFFEDLMRLVQERIKA